MQMAGGGDSTSREVQDINPKEYEGKGPKLL